MKCLIILMLIVSAWAALNPLENPNLFQGNLMRKGYNPKIFQGDMILMDESDRSAILNNTHRWPGGIIPYEIVALGHKGKKIIERAMKNIMDKTCIKFVPWDRKEKDYVVLFPGYRNPPTGCASFVGRAGNAQGVSLAEGCMDFGTILHELMHVIGFIHEQNRDDRDDYLVIHELNIWPAAVSQFDKKESQLINDFDYDSIMLYGAKAFSKDGTSKTMESTKEGVKLRDVVSKGKLSDSDFTRINTLYECDVKE